MNKRIRNKEIGRKASSRYRKENPAKNRLQGIRSKTIKRGIEFSIDIRDFVEWFNLQPDNCYYCKRKFENKCDMQVDRKNPKEGYTIENIVLACSTCNRLKSNIFTDLEWLDILEKYKISDRY